MSTAQVTSKGQITIPVSVRKRLGLETGDRVEFIELENGEFVMKPAVHDVRTLKGMLKKPEGPVTEEEMKSVIRRRGAGQ
jgi:antitoxin PrlF